MSGPEHNAKQRRSARNVSLIAAAWVMGASLAVAQSAPQRAKPQRAHKPSPAQPAVPAPAPEEQAPPTPQPEQPKWPANDAPSQPSVTWNSQGLHIQATNSSLSKILNEVSTQTGAKVQGIGTDERVFGDFGPGQPRDVLAELLTGSAYNFILLGNTDGPLTVILSTRRGGGTTSAPDRNVNRQPQQDMQPDEDQGEPDQDEAPPVQQPFQPPPQPEPDSNPQGQMTPQQRMQMMQQQRLQQMQQLQQQQQQQPQ